MWTWGILIILQITQIWAQVVKVNVTAGDFYLELKWEETKNDVNYSLGYGTHGNITHKDISYTISTDNVATYLLNNLQPGETYELQLIKVGQEVFKSTRTTKPLPPSSIIVPEAGTRHLFFTWKTDVRSTQDSYRVRVTEVSNNSEIFKSDSIHVQFYNLTGLYPGLVYSIAIETISNGQISNGTTSIQDNTRPLSPTIHWIIAIDNYTLMLAWREDFNSIQDHVQLTAIYNNTHNLTGEINLTCTMLLTTCWTLVPWVIPGTPIEVRAYAVKNNRRSDPDITYHSTKPETVSSLTEANSSTSFLQLSVTQPFHSVFVGYSVSIDDGYYYFRNYTFPADQSTFLIGNLTAGIEYNVSVGTMSEWEESSQQFSRLFYTYPNMPRNLRIYNGDINTTSLKVSWDPVTSGELDYYDVMISPKETLTHSPVLQYNTAMRTVTFDSLTPGRMYTITVKSVKAQKRSTAVTLIQYTKPNPPAKINYTVMGGREIYLNWYPPTTGVVENYTVSIVSLGMHGVTNNTLPIAPVTLQGTTYTLRQLHPGETYEISVTSRSGGVTSIPLKINATTDPTSVTEIFVDHVTENHINMSWSRPENLTFKTFKLTIDPPDTTSPVEILESAGILFHSFTGLHPGTVYNLSVFLMLGTAVIDKTIRTAITDPVPIDDINITTHDTSSLLLNWFVTRSLQQHHFELMYTSFDGSSNTSLPMVLAHSDQYSYQYTITKLNAGSMYTVYIRAVQEFDDLKSYSSWLKVNKTTKPKSVTKLSATVSNQDITLSWKPDVNSTQDNYIVWYRPMLAPFTQLGKQTNTQLQQTTLRGMYAGERYELIVFAVSMNEMSLPRSVFAEVPPLQPSSITATKVSTDSVSVTWTYNLSATYVEEFELTYTSYVSDSQGIMVVSGGNSTSVVTIGNLTSGEMYIVSILSVAANMTSEVASVNVTVKPLILTALLEYPGLTTSDKIGIQYTAVTNYFDYFKFTLVNDTSRPPVIKSRTDTDRLVTFDRLEGGTQYVVQVVTVSGAESSSPIYISILTAPNRPHVDQISTATEITLIVNKPSGRVDSYLIICALNSMPCGSQTIDASKDKVTVPFDKLTPYQKYKFQIVSFAGLKNMSFFLEIETAQAAPSAVHNLRAVETEPRMVTLTWNAPTVTNGIITAYIVEYKGRKTDLDPVIDSSVRTIIVDSSSAFNDPISYQIPQMLTAGLKYTFKVYGKTVANGPADQTDLTTRTYNPKLKDGISSDMAAPKPPKDRPATPTTIPVEFTNAFSEDYGEIIQYTIIVATSTDKDYLNTNTLPGWKAYQNDPSIKAYQAISNCSDFFDSDSTCGDRLRLRKRSATQGQNKIFVIGSEADCKDPHYCNGPLKQNTQYYFKLRAYTNGGYADTVYSSPFSTGSVTEASNYGGIIGGVVAAVVVIGLILLAVLFLRRNLRAKSNMYRQGQDHRMTPRSSIRGTKKKHEINILNFRDHVISLSADSDFKYAEEFEDLKEVGRDQSCSAAELPVNRGKNRFTNILPYDHSRVKLLPTDDEEGSDYINANYMPGFSSKREYIVTQGPLPSTRDDFWRMIWEQNSRNIVMLTKCVEKGREKCDQYWPVGSDAIFYGDIQVAVLNETKFPSWTITEFRIALGDLTRQIRHFHFTAWPDFGVPDKPQTLIRFVRIVREKLYRECGPMVVHCSAGVGRSGTYIALDRLLQDIIEHDIIDIFNVVAEMRKERVWMVQTEQQYVCIHQCLMCVLDGREEEHIYENSGNVNQAFEDDEGINVEVP